MKSKLYTYLLVLMVLFPAFGSPTLALAQDRADVSVEDLARLDTTTSLFPTVEYEIVDAEIPSDRIVIDESTIYSTELYDLTEHYDDVVYNQGRAYEAMPKENFRDATTYVNLYLYYSNPDKLEIIAPIHISPDLLETYEVDRLISSLWSDIFFKNQHGFIMNYTDDLFEAYEMHNYFTDEMMADVKADLLRAEDIMASVEDTSSYSYTLAEEKMEEIYNEYETFERRYNNSRLEEPKIEYAMSDDVTETEITTENMALIQEAIGHLPEHLQHRLHYISLVTPYELPVSWNYETIHAFATQNLEMFFIDSQTFSIGLVYHELGHVVDFSTVIYDSSYLGEEYNSLSKNDDWLAIHEAEWAEEGSYYDTPMESFAQGFGSYAVEYYLGQTMEEVGYVDYGLEGRPETRTYFEALFERLDY